MKKPSGISGNLTIAIAETARPTGDWRLASTSRCAVLLFQSFQDPISQFHPLRIGVTFIR